MLLPFPQEAVNEKALKEFGLDYEICQMLRDVRSGTGLFKGHANYLIRKRFAKRTETGIVLTCLGRTLLEGAEILIGDRKVIDITAKRRAHSAGG